MPAAWEILDDRRKRVFLAVLSPPDGRVSMPWAKSFRQMILPTADSIMATIAGLPYGPARNQALKNAVEGGYAYLAFVDSDVVLPKDWILQLMKAERDLIACQYYRRYLPFDSAHANTTKDKDGKEVRTPIQPHQPGEIIPVDVLATGAMLISRRCMLAVFEKYRRPFEWGQDIAEVPGDDGPLPAVGEDYMYCLRAREMGFQAWLYTGIEARHEMTVAVTYKGLEPQYERVAR